MIYLLKIYFLDLVLNDESALTWILSVPFQDSALKKHSELQKSSHSLLVEIGPRYVNLMLIYIHYSTHLQEGNIDILYSLQRGSNHGPLALGASIIPRDHRAVQKIS